MAAAHQPFLVKCVEGFVPPGSGPYLIHSFGPWGDDVGLFQPPPVFHGFEPPFGEIRVAESSIHG